MPALLIIVMLLTLSGCGTETPDNATSGRIISVSERMGAAPQPGFKRADKPRDFDFPNDHSAHPEYATEWWYFTGNLQSDSGQTFGYQLTLFRVGLAAGTPPEDSPLRANQLYMGHLAITDITGEQHHSAERFSRAAAGLAGAQALPLRIWLGGWSITGSGTGQDDSFPIDLKAESDHIAIELTVAQGDKPRVLQGDAGLSQKSSAPGNASYYYSYTRLPTSGRLRISDTWHSVQGNSWWDREWSSSALAEDQAGWDWFSLQLDDGRDLMFYRMRDKHGEGQRYSKGVLVDGKSAPRKLTLDNTRLQAIRHWRSETSGIRYPIGWRLQMPEDNIDLQIEAVLPDQEMNLSVRYWEGAVRVTGSQTGVGYLEMSGYTAEP